MSLHMIIHISELARYVVDVRNTIQRPSSPRSVNTMMSALPLGVSGQSGHCMVYCLCSFSFLTRNEPCL